MYNEEFSHIVGGSAYAQNYEGILINDGDNSWIDNVELGSCGRCGIIETSTSAATVKSLTVNNCFSDGICVLGASCNVYWNTTTGNGGNGGITVVSYGSPADANVLENVSCYNQGYGFYKYNATVQLSGNTAYQNALGTKNW